MKSASKQNINSFMYLSIAYTIFLLVVFGYSIASIFMDSVPVLGQRYNVSYLLTMLIMLAVSILLNSLFMYRYKQSKRSNPIDDNVTFFFGVIQFIFAISCSLYLSVWTSPDTLAVGFILILACSTFLIVISPLTNLILIFGAMAAFLVSTVVLSDPAIWLVNIIHVFAAGVFGALLNWIMNMYKMQALSNTIKLEREYILNAQLQTKEKEYYFAQCALMQESMERVRSIRHDMKLHLATLKDFAIGGTVKELKKYLDNLVDDIENSEVYSDTGNIALDSIINYKLRNAKSDNIMLDLSIAVPPELNIEVVDIVTVLGNLLDNALEAVEKVDKKMIKLDIEFVKGCLFVKIDNSFDGEVKYSSEQAGADKQILSLKSGGEHGCGLKNISQSIEKYNGYMKITHTESIFSTVVFLYVDGAKNLAKD